MWGWGFVADGKEEPPNERTKHRRQEQKTNQTHWATECHPRQVHTSPFLLPFHLRTVLFPTVLPLLYLHEQKQSTYNSNNDFGESLWQRRTKRISNFDILEGELQPQCRRRHSRPPPLWNPYAKSSPNSGRCCCFCSRVDKYNTLRFRYQAADTMERSRRWDRV